MGGTGVRHPSRAALSSQSSPEGVVANDGGRILCCTIPENAESPSSHHSTRALTTP